MEGFEERCEQICFKRIALAAVLRTDYRRVKVEARRQLGSSCKNPGKNQWELGPRW